MYRHICNQLLHKFGGKMFNLHVCPCPNFRADDLSWVTTDGKDAVRTSASTGIVGSISKCNIHLSMLSNCQITTTFLFFIFYQAFRTKLVLLNFQITDQQWLSTPATRSAPLLSKCLLATECGTLKFLDWKLSLQSMWLGLRYVLLSKRVQ